MAINPGKRELNSDVKKEMILEKSMELFKKHDYEKITIIDICKECNVNVGTVYHFFGSKIGILQAISEKLIVPDELERNDPELVKNPYNVILKYLLIYARRWETLGADLTTQIFKNFQNIYINPNTSTFKEKSSIRPIANFIRESQKAGYFNANTKPLEAANLIMLVARGLVYDWCMHNGSYDLEEKAAWMMDTLGRNLIVNTTAKK